MLAPCLSDAHLQRYQSNLDSLRRTGSPLVQVLEALEIPSNVEPAVGRDGSDTFRIRRDDGTWHWLGRSSMPAVSSTATLEAFRSKGRNVILTGVGTGREALLIARRSPPHCAVLVYEGDPLLLKLALHLEDYSQPIQSGRVILLGGADLAAALAAEFERRPGLEFPQEMLPLPGQSPADQDRTRLVLQATAQRVARAQAEAAARLGREISGRSCAPPAGPPRVAVLSRDPRPEAVELAGALTATLDRQGWPAEMCVPDRPDACHTVARLGLVARHRPNLVLLLNCAAGPLAHFLPKDLPLCSWLVTADSVEAVLHESPAAGETFFVAQAAGVERLTSAGVAADRVHLLERGTDPASYAPMEVSGEARDRFSSQVAVMADAFDLRAAAAGISLATHVRLWDALIKRTENVIARWRDGLAEQVLERSQRDSNTRLGDPELREQFVTLIRHRLVPTLVARAAIARLADDGLELAVWGDAPEADAVRPGASAPTHLDLRVGSPSPWYALAAPAVSAAGRNTEDTAHRAVAHPNIQVRRSTSSRLRGPAGDSAARNAIFNAAEVVVFPWFGELTAQMVLDCLAAGGCPVFVSPEQRLDVLHPQLHRVLRVVPGAASVEGVVPLVRRLLAGADARRQATADARRLVLEEHTLAARLHVIGRKMLRG